MLETSLGELGYGGIVEAHPAGERDCRRGGTRFIWRTQTKAGEACVYRNAVEVLNAKPIR